jgi:guanylate kinase
VGKDAVLAAAFASPDSPRGLLRCITATTRTPRAGEVHGRDYHFLSREAFEAHIREGFFLEHALYNGDYYGTPRDFPERERTLDRDVLLKIEVKGALQVRVRVPEAILVFLAPPSWEELERRLRARNTDDQAKVAARLAIAREEINTAPAYDYLVVNAEIGEAVRSLHAIVRAERCRIRSAGE